MAKRRNLLDAVKVGFTLSADQVVWLNEAAEAEDRSMSAIIRRLITEERDRLAASNDSAALAEFVADKVRKLGTEPKDA